MPQAGDEWAKRVRELEAELHYWRTLVTPVKLGLEGLRRQRPDLAHEINDLLRMFDREVRRES